MLTCRYIISSRGLNLLPILEISTCQEAKPSAPKLYREVSPSLLTGCSCPRPLSMPLTNPYQCISLSFFLITSLVLLSYFLSQFPHAPQGYSVHPSLASLGPETKAMDIYPEEYYPGGAYVSLPFGNVRVHLPIRHVPTP